MEKVKADAISRAARAASKADGSLDMAKFEKVYLRERAKAFVLADDRARAQAIRNASLMEGSAAYIAQYVAERNLCR